jgi:lipoic acid synthetase
MLNKDTGTRIESMERKPDWLRKRITVDTDAGETEGILAQLGLNTVCLEADCPNYSECFTKRTATFMILGTHCTRNCRFCNVTHGEPQAVDPSEPERVAEAVNKLGLKYVVVTSVTRDDLPDGGAGHFAAVISAIRQCSPETAVEVLVPDFQGLESALQTVADAAPDVISHNMETVKALYSAVRPEAVYERSLSLIGRIREMSPDIKSKSGIMVGVGETPGQVLSLMDDLRAEGCQFLTIGQYLAPSKQHHPVIEYVTPETFDFYAKSAYEKDFDFVASAPFVRSSYNAGDALGR